MKREKKALKFKSGNTKEKAILNGFLKAFILEIAMLDGAQENEKGCIFDPTFSAIGVLFCPIKGTPQKVK